MSLAPLRDATSRQRHDGDPPDRAAAVAVRPGTADAAVDHATWSETEPYGLRAPIGVGPTARSSSTSSSTDPTR